MLCFYEQLSQLKPQSVVSGYAKKYTWLSEPGIYEGAKHAYTERRQKCTKAYIKRYTGNVASKAVFLNDGLVYNVS